MFKQRLHNLYILLLSSRKPSRSSSSNAVMPATAPEGSSQKAIELLYHRGFINKAHGTATDKNADGVEWVIN